MNHSIALKKLMPIDLGDISDRDMDAEGEVLDVVLGEIVAVSSEWFPSLTGILLARWEVEYGLRPAVSDTTQTRQDALCAKYIGVGSLDKQHFVTLAATLGYASIITEGGESHSMFRVGVTLLPSPLFAPTAMWSWTVTTTNKPPEADIKRLFEDLSPPHMRLFWSYSPA